MDWSNITPISTEPFTFGPIQTKWLEALESGEWLQGKLELKSLFSFQGNPDEPVKHAYCCLGVLCELCGLDWTAGPASIGFEFGNNSGYHNNYLPGGFEEIIGLRNSWASFIIQIKTATGTPFTSLTEMNDSDIGITFKDIAAYIRHDPHNVFAKSA